MAVALAVRFLLELCALAALAYWGATTGNGAVSIALAIVAPLAVIVVWALWVAPKASRRLDDPARFAAETAVWAAATAGLVAAGQPILAVVFAVLAVASSFAARRFEPHAHLDSAA